MISRSKYGGILRAAVVAMIVAAVVAVLFIWKSADSNPLEKMSLYVIPDTQAAQQAKYSGLQSRPADNAAMRQLAAEPMAEWFNGGSPADVEHRAHVLAVNAAKMGKTLVGVVYNRPNRDCQGKSAGAQLTNDDYRAWVLGLIRGLTVVDHPEFRAVLIYEPDAVAQTVGRQACLKGQAATQLLNLLSETISKLKTRPNLMVYLDAGHSGWFTDPDPVVTALRTAGAEFADGLAVNVSNFQTTDDSLRYGRTLSDKLGGLHFVIDTSRNGAGPYLGTGDEVNDPVWCNPPGRKVGRRPSTNTNENRLDAYLWVKHTGESDGNCRPSDPPAGHWMPSYALATLKSG